MISTPFVMVYRVSPLTYMLGKPRVKVPYFAMVNLIAGREVVPELVQHDFTAKNVVERLQEILPDGTARDRMIEGMANVRHQLRPPKDDSGTLTLTPAERAAEIILSLGRSPNL
jgi:lipid-A-disaccharide synthase